MLKGCVLHKVSYVLVLVGALNWGLIGVAKWNLVTALLGGFSMVERLVYILVGAAAVLMLVAPSCKPCKECMVK
ncbi:MAG: DUF378 domain-containing protein [bacterium]